MSIKKYIEHHIQLHTLRIELISGKVLLYNIDAHRKEDLEKWLLARTDDLMNFSDDFISFYASPGRMVFIRISAIKRLIFCWDAAVTVSDAWQYHDHFEVTSKFEDELLIPEVIIQLHAVSEPLVFSDLDPNSDFLGINEESFSNDQFLKGGFISLPDEDGEQNYIPVKNIDCLEVDRAFIYPDDIWEEMERIRYIENNQN
ncbi:MAG: hypothetical protein H0V14_04315 [Chitinophagaceae bacterium]|nr:hypothetical protein [Chitinophagaceae bacterium]